MHPHIAPEQVTYEALVDRALSLIKPGSRAILGIVGAPGAGKSTLAGSIATSVNERFGERRINPGGRTLEAAPATEAGRIAPPTALAIPMDGFHLAHSLLEERGDVSRKGALHTFDGWGFLSLLQRIRAADHTVYAPEYRRDIGEPVAGAIPINPAIPLIIVEGNYLLADGPGWSQVRTYLTETWFIALDEDVRLGRLIDRHGRFGRSKEAATRHALGSDQQNAVLINETAARADLIVDIKNW